MKFAVGLLFASCISASPVNSRVDTGSVTAPSLQPLEARYGDWAPGAKRAKVRYGPYTLPSIKDVTALSKLSGEQGTMTGLSFALQKPCSGECNILTAQAGLEYADGRAANVSTGAWLHHIVLILGGKGHVDSTCSIMPGERIFSSGIEQNQLNYTDLAHRKIKAALPLRTADTLHMQYELMNMLDTAQNVYVTVDYEYMPGKLPQDWKSSKILWLDITGCPGISSMLPPKGKTQFTLKMPAWKSTFDGEILDIGGHLHDGGVDVKVYHNDAVICKSVASYSGGGAMSDMGSMAMKRSVNHGPSSDGQDHISEMTTCTDQGSFKKGDRIYVDATYDFDKYKGMKSTAGWYTEIMGIALAMVAVDP